LRHSGGLADNFPTANCGAVSSEFASSLLAFGESDSREKCREHERGNRIVRATV